MIDLARFTATRLPGQRLAWPEGDVPLDAPIRFVPGEGEIVSLVHQPGSIFRRKDPVHTELVLELAAPGLAGLSPGARVPVRRAALVMGTDRILWRGTRCEGHVVFVKPGTLGLDLRFPTPDLDSEDRGPQTVRGEVALQ